MKIIIRFIFILTLALSNNAFTMDLDKITDNVKSVCLSPSEAGKYWTFNATGKVNGEGTVRLISLGVNGEATFTKGEWEGVQQVLKEQQSAEHANYRDCAEKLTPLFLNKFSSSAQTTTNTIQLEANGNKSPAIIGNTVTIIYEKDPDATTDIYKKSKQKPNTDSNESEPQIVFGIVSEIFEISNIHHGKAIASNPVLDQMGIMDPLSKKQDAILFDVKIKSGNGLPNDYTWLGAYFGKILDKDNLKCGVAQIQIKLKYDTISNGWQIGMPGTGQLFYDAPGCNVSRITFEDTSPFGIDE